MSENEVNMKLCDRRSETGVSGGSLSANRQKISVEPAGFNVQESTGAEVFNETFSFHSHESR